MLRIPTPVRTGLTLAFLACALPVNTLGSSLSPTIVDFTSGVIPNATPRNITAGPDGNLWFTYGDNAGRIGRITPGGLATQYVSGIPSGSGPYDIAAGPDGNMWFTLNALGAIGRLEPATGTVTLYTGPLTSASAPTGIAAGPDGAMWFTHAGAGGGVGRISTSGSITLSPVLSPLNAAPTDITAGPDGRMWFTLKDGPAIGAVVPGTGSIAIYATGLTAGNSPEQIASDGTRLWVTLQGDPGYLADVSTAGAITRHDQGLPGNAKPTGVAVDGTGRVWITVRDAEKVGYYDPADGIHTYTVGNAVKPNGMTGDAAGNVWFVGRDSPARASRIGVMPPVLGAPADAPLSGGRVTISVPLNGNGQITDYRVEYGATAAYGSVGTGRIDSTSSASQTVAVTLTGLTAGTTYHYRAFAQNDSGSAATTDGTFTATTGGSGDAGIAPATRPVQGVSMTAKPVRGKVTVRLPGAKKDVALTSVGGQLPVGTVVDTTRGRIRLRSARRKGFQTAEFWGGRFTVRQARNGIGYTGVVTDRRPLAGCSRTGTAAAHEAGTTKPPRRRILWGRDRRGKFRTHGRNSVATVRGTRWLTIESCAGTITRVVEGGVAVRDLRRKRTVLVKAGRAYLARGSKR